MEMLGRYLNVSNEKLKSNGVLSVRSRVTNLKDCAGGTKKPECGAGGPVLW